MRVAEQLDLSYFNPSHLFRVAVYRYTSPDAFLGVHDQRTQQRSSYHTAYLYIRLSHLQIVVLVADLLIDDIIF